MLSLSELNLSQIYQEAGPLETALNAGAIERVLFCHINSRWYLGELFCHASWIESLAAAGLSITVCTKDSFLELFSQHPAVGKLISVNDYKPVLCADYPLVVFTSTHPPENFAKDIEHGIYSWNKGMAYVYKGHVLQQIEKSAVNLFRATRPDCGQLPLPIGGYLPLHLSDNELAEGGLWLDQLGIGREQNIILLNPSASNPVTRRSNRPKAVDNLLCVEDYSLLLRALQKRFPSTIILVGSPVLACDEHNLCLVRELCDDADSSISPVIPLLGNTPAKTGIGFREFAALLLDYRVRGMIGNSTGTNTHLAASFGLPALSIERAVDDSVRANWAAPHRGQMGSVAWRNPEPRMAAYALSWQEHCEDDFLHIAEAFWLHVCANEGRWEELFGAPGKLFYNGDRAYTFYEKGEECIGIAHFENSETIESWLLWLLQCRNAFTSRHAINFYFNLSEEAAFLQARGKIEATAIVVCIDSMRETRSPLATCGLAPPPLEDQLIMMELLTDSNLFKLLNLLMDK